MSSQPLLPVSNTANTEPPPATKHYCHLQILKLLQNRQLDVESEQHSLYAPRMHDGKVVRRSELERGLSWISRALVPAPNKGHIAAVCLSKEVNNGLPSVFLNVSSNEPTDSRDGETIQTLFDLLKKLFAEQENHLSDTGRLTIDPTLLESQLRHLEEFIISHCWKSFVGRMEDISGLPLPALDPEEADKTKFDLTGPRKGYIDDYVRVLTGLHTRYNKHLGLSKSVRDGDVEQTSDLEELMTTFRRILENSTNARGSLKKKKLSLPADQQSKVVLFNQMMELCSQLLTKSKPLAFAASFLRSEDSQNKQHEVPSPERLVQFGIATTHSQFAFLAKIHRRVDRLVQYRKGCMSVLEGVFTEIRTHCRAGQFELRKACTLVPELTNGSVKPTLSPKEYVGGLLQKLCDEGRLRNLTADETADVKRKVQDCWKKDTTIDTRVHCEVRLIHAMAKLVGQSEIIYDTFAVSKRCCLSCHHYLTSLLASSGKTWRFSGCSWKPHYGWNAPVPTTPDNAWFTDEATHKAIRETYDMLEKRVMHAIIVSVRGGGANSGTDTSYSARGSSSLDVAILTQGQS